MAKTSKQFYTDAANFLRRIGVNVSYKGNKKPTPHQKAAVKKYYNIYGGFDNKRLVFVKASGAKKKQLQALVSKEQRTPKGVILVRPRNVEKKDFKYKIVTKNGKRFIQYKIGDKRRDVYVHLSAEDLATQPHLALINAIADVHPEILKTIPQKDDEYDGEPFDPTDLKKALHKFEDMPGKPQQVKLVVNGNDQMNGKDIYQLYQYLETLREGGTKSPMDEEDFADVFTVKLIYNETL